MNKRHVCIIHANEHTPVEQEAQTQVARTYTTNISSPSTLTGARNGDGLTFSFFSPLFLFF
jgi:hypothetical protein